MRIGDLSRKTGVAAHLLRYYETQGLLQPKRGRNGYREYDADTLTTVSQIRRMLEAGLSSQEIAQLLPCATTSLPELEPCPEVLGVLRARLTDLNNRIHTLEEARTALGHFLRRTEDAAESA